MLAPAGNDKRKDKIRPIAKESTEIITAHIVTERKLLHTCIAVRVGKIIRLEISIVPIIRMPITMVTAVKRAIIIVYSAVLMPRDCAKDSSKVIANIFR